jgi:hypothetical protein
MATTSIAMMANKKKIPNAELEPITVGASGTTEKPINTTMNIIKGLALNKKEDAALGTMSSF